MHCGCFITLLFLTSQLLSSEGERYVPTWSSLDSRALPKWYDESKFGLFMHWGLYSVPSFSSEWFWEQWKGSHNKAAEKFMKDNYRPGFTYQDFGPQFTAEFFDPDKFAKTIKASGAKYIVHTSKHHEGYTMYPSNYSWNWNSLDVGPGRDIVGELRQSVLKVGGVHFGLYFSQYEWFNPLYLNDKSKQFSTQDYVKTTSIPQMHEIVNLYKPDIVWSDGDWEAPDTYWNSTEFLAWLYNDSPVKQSVVVNDRWGSGTACKHGGYYTCQDHYDPGKLQAHKWENCMTVDANSWGFRRTMTYQDVLSIEKLTEKLARTVSCGGNLLLNVGPTHDGRIVPIFEERLLQLGKFLNVNGEAIYGTKPWIYQNDSYSGNVWYTSKMKNSEHYPADRIFNPQNKENTVVYAIVLDWPKNNKLILGSARPTSQTQIRMLGYSGNVRFVPGADRIAIDLSTIPWKQLPTTWAWVFKMEHLQTEDYYPEFHNGYGNELLKEKSEKLFETYENEK